MYLRPMRNSKISLYRKICSYIRKVIKDMSYSKYRSTRVKLGDLNFDSKKEYLRYCELIILQKAKRIKDLILQPEFILLDAFVHDGKKERKITYKADFKYIDMYTQNLVVEDVKGFKTKTYKLKRKMFLSKYGHLFEFLET